VPAVSGERVCKVSTVYADEAQCASWKPPLRPPASLLEALVVPDSDQPVGVWLAPLASKLGLVNVDAADATGITAAKTPTPTSVASPSTRDVVSRALLGMTALQV